MQVDTAGLEEELGVLLSGAEEPTDEQKPTITVQRYDASGSLSDLSVVTEMSH